MKTIRLNPLMLVAFAGLLLAFRATAQDNTATNSTETAQIAPADSAEKTEIEDLKKEIQELEKKVNALEQQQISQQQPAQIQKLNQKVGDLEQQRKLGEQTAAEAAKAAPKISIGADGFKIVSADTNFAMNIRGYMQLDSRTFVQNAQPGADGFILRRVHPIIAGTVFHDFDYQFMAEFGGAAPSIYDAYLNYHPWPEVQLQAGRFKMPVGLEWLQSAVNLSFNERSLANDLVPLRDLGVELHGDLFGGRANYAAGIFNSDVDGANAANADLDNDMEFAGRVFLQPMKKSGIAPLEGLGFGVSGTYGNEYGAGALTSGYVTEGQQKFFTYAGTVANGAHWRISPQGYYYWGPFDLLGEYVISDQQVKLTAAPGTAADLQNTAWEVSAGWVLTGENASYSGVTPQRPFSLQNGGWGAWQIVARLEGFDVDNAAFPTFASPTTSASAARAWAVGLNWWLNKNVRVMTSFSRTTFTGGATGAVTKDPEEVFFTRLQLSF
ncbi:MAG TPA: porin [Verrucomicrobiae bacterium]|jgi:phosphate-selective porin OprO/OprP